MVRLTESTGEVTTEEMVSTALERIQRNYGDLTCPHVRFTDGRLLKAFSCDDCSCLYEMALMEKKQPVRFQATNHHHIHQSDCICQQPWEKRQRPLHNEWYDRTTTSSWSLRDRKKTEKPDDDFEFAEHCVSCRFFNAQYKWNRRGNEFWLSFRQRLAIENLVPSYKFLAFPGAYFVESIEPSSYGHEADLTSKHVSWSTNSTCANNHGRAVRHSLLRKNIAFWT